MKGTHCQFFFFQKSLFVSVPVNFWHRVSKIFNITCDMSQAIKLDGLSVAETKQLRDRAEKFEFQAEVNRMMKLIINSLYKNKEVKLN